MSMKKEIRISDSEWEVMRIIWTKGQSDAKEIYTLLGEAMSWKMATIKTLLGRLVKKEAISAEQRGKKFIYRPLLQEEDVVRDAISEVLARLCATKVKQTLIDIIQTSEFTIKDIEEVKVMLNHKSTVKEIKCNCLPGQCLCTNHHTKERER